MYFLGGNREILSLPYSKHIQSIHKKLGGIPLSVAVDVRYDTPGK